MKSFSKWVEVVFVWKTKHCNNGEKTLFKFSGRQWEEITEIANAQV